MSGNLPKGAPKLSQILKKLQDETGASRCAVCSAYTKMDDEDKASFVQVMDSQIPVKNIANALLEVGIVLSRYQVGDARRECLKGNKPCQTFKAEKK
jgi:hypothetical protein